MNAVYKNLGLWLVICLVMIMLFHLFNQAKAPQEEISYSQFRQEVDQGAVKQVIIQGNRLKGTFMDGSRNFRTYAPADTDLVPNLMKNKVDIKVMPEDDNPWYLTALISWLDMPARSKDSADASSLAEPTIAAVLEARYSKFEKSGTD